MTSFGVKGLNTRSPLNTKCECTFESVVRKCYSKLHLKFSAVFFVSSPLHCAFCLFGFLSFGVLSVYTHTHMSKMACTLYLDEVWDPNSVKLHLGFVNTGLGFTVMFRFIMTST